MKLMPEWEELAVERRCEVGRVGVNDVLRAMAAALERGDQTEEELVRMKAEQDRMIAECNEAMWAISARVSKARAKREVDLILREGWR